ncbi:MAG: TIR domain-containing protein [Bacteroidetes bacterium]|jgi:hypothetical protein|nr:TIR domain-containing protein [Bacteroidota bacterium]
MENTKTVRQVFLSHASADRKTARHIAGALSQHARVRIFSTDMLSAGGDWQSKLKDELSDSDLFILLVSEAAVGSNLILQEYGAAWAMSKPIILVFVDPLSQASADQLPFSGDVLATPEDFENPAFVRSLIERLNASESGAVAE